MNLISKAKSVISIYSYAILDIVLKLFAYIALPVYAKFMSPADYGQYNLVISYMTVASVLLSLNVWSGIVVYKNRDGFINEYVLFGVITILHVISLLIGFTFSTLFNWNLIFVILVIGTSYFQSFFNIVTEVYRAKEEIKKYSIIKLAFSFLSTFLGISVVIGVAGNKFILLSSSMLATLVVVTAPYIFKSIINIGDSKNWEDIKKYLTFSIPLIPFALSSILLVYFDRFVIEQYCGMSDVGIYSFGYNIAMIINVLAIGLNKSYQPKYYQLMSFSPEKIESYTMKYHLSFIASLFGFTLVFPIMLNFLKLENFVDSINLIYIIILSYTLIYFYAINSNALYYHGKTRLISLITMAAAGINLILDLLTIPQYGVLAAAITTYIAYLFLTMGILIYRNIIEPFNWKKELMFMLFAHLGVIVLWGGMHGFI